MNADRRALTLDIASRIRKVREDAGLSQARFAELVGLESQAHVSRIELAENHASSFLINSISSAFLVTTDYLLKGTDNRSPLNKLYVGYHVEMHNALGKDALEYLHKCIQTIQKLDEENSARIFQLQQELSRYNGGVIEKDREDDEI